MSFLKAQKLIGGHRGSPKKAKENTLLSFETAIDDGVDFIEFDVRKSADDILIIHHDEDLAGKVLRNLTYSEINQLAESNGFSVPTLDDVIALCNGKIMLDVEIKEPEVTEETAKILLKSFPVDKFIVTSFYDAVLATLNESFPSIKKGLLLGNKSNIEVKKRVVELKPNFLLPHYTIFEKDRNIREICETFNLTTILWTVNNKLKMEELLKEPLVTAIISDYPESGVKVKETLSR
ncbi:MAG: glycerophosphodiester phosphodiesterase [bacterium]